MKHEFNNSTDDQAQSLFENTTEDDAVDHCPICNAPLPPGAKTYFDCVKCAADWKEIPYDEESFGASVIHGLTEILDNLEDGEKIEDLSHRTIHKATLDNIIN